nr:MAG TPA: hypothetical protein [Caudoviricetes sp.]
MLQIRKQIALHVMYYAQYKFLMVSVLKLSRNMLIALIYLNQWQRQLLRIGKAINIILHVKIIIDSMTMYIAILVAIH